MGTGFISILPKNVVEVRAPPKNVEARAKVIRDGFGRKVSSMKSHRKRDGCAVPYDPLIKKRAILSQNTFALRLGPILWRSPNLQPHLW